MMNEQKLNAMIKAFGEDNVENYCICAAYDYISTWTQTNKFDNVREAAEHITIALRLDGFTAIQPDKERTELLVITQGSGLTVGHYICSAFELLNVLGNKSGSNYATTLVQIDGYLQEAVRLWDDSNIITY